MRQRDNGVGGSGEIAAQYIQVVQGAKINDRSDDKGEKKQAYPLSSLSVPSPPS